MARSEAPQAPTTTNGNGHKGGKTKATGPGNGRGGRERKS